MFWTAGIDLRLTALSTVLNIVLCHFFSDAAVVVILTVAFVIVNFFGGSKATTLMDLVDRFEEPVYV